MKKKVIFYMPEKTRNDATIYYTKLIEKAFIDLGFIAEYKLKIFKAFPDDFIVTVTPADTWYIKRMNPQNKIMTWFQGIGPEEYSLLHGRNLRSLIMKKYLEFFERKALLKSDICLFVSDAMQQHYRAKYDLIPSNYIVVPCYNKKLRKDLLQTEGRYEKLSFVYAGGMFAWQCIDETLKVFKLVETHYPDAYLTLLTGDRIIAEKLINKYKVKNVSIKYVKLEELDEELSQYKYGFLLRDNIKVNNVATPTKMNSYLSVGVMPIYSDVVDSFEQHLNLIPFCVKVDYKAARKDVVDQIVKHNNLEIDINRFKIKLEELFDDYYSDDKYMALLKKSIKKVK